MENMEVTEVHSVPTFPWPNQCPRPPISAPPSRLNEYSPSSMITQSSPLTSETVHFMRTPLGSPMKKVVETMRGYLEDVGHLDPQDAWLPITESRNGNAYYSAFHMISSGIGFQALVLPVAFISLGWTWGVLCLSAAFIWQLYTMWLLVQLHESVPGTRYCRYLQLAQVTFGPKLGKALVKIPIMYLSAGTCSALILVGGGSMKLFFEIICGEKDFEPLTAVEWYLVFICLAVVLAQLPNLNSIAGISLIGSVTAVAYCTTIWVTSVIKGKQTGLSSDSVKDKSDVGSLISILNAIGIIAFTFRGHNLVLEIQATMPSSLKHPSHIPMWRGVKAAYAVIALCLYPIAICGFWVYGNLIPSNGILKALYKFHSKDTSKGVLGLTTILVIINCLTSFQIYAMPVFDNLEAKYTKRKNKPCPRWLRAGLRAVFGSIVFLVAVALPFLPDLAGLLGAISLPVTMAYPCFMWIVIKKPERYNNMWYINWALGSLGMSLSVLLVVGGIWRIVDVGFDLRFFKPQ